MCEDGMLVEYYLIIFTEYLEYLIIDLKIHLNILLMWKMMIRIPKEINCVISAHTPIHK